MSRQIQFNRSRFVTSWLMLWAITGSFGSFGTIKPNPGDGIENLSLENFDVQLNKPDPTLHGVTNLVVKNVKVNGKDYNGPG